MSLVPLLLALATACGGAGSQVVSSNNGALASVHDAIPADAAWVFVGRNHPDHVDAFRSTWLQQFSSLPGAELEEMMAYTGIDWSSPTALQQTGIDLEGEFAAFALNAGPVVLVELTDTAAFNAMVTSIEDANPDWEIHPTSWLDLDDARSWDANDGIGVDLGLTDRFAVLRIRTGLDGMDLTDDDVMRSLRGFAAGDRFYDMEAAARLRELAQTEVWTYGWARTGALDDVVRVTQHFMGFDAEAAPVCEVAREQFETTIPWFGMWTTFDPSDSMQTTTGWMAHFSAAGAERMRAAFPPTLGSAMDHADGAAFSAVGTANLRALMDVVRADPAAARCPGIAAVSGTMAELIANNQRTIDYNLEFFDGTFGFGLFDIRMAGFLPFVDAIVMIGSEKPTEVMEFIQDMLEQQGGRGEVDADAALTTLEYGLMHLSITLVKAQDRVVIAIGDIPQAFMNTLATAAPDAESSPFYHFVWDGERVRALLDMGLGYVTDNGIFTDDQLEPMRASLAQWYAVDRMTMTAGFDGADLVMTMSSVLDFDAGPAPQP